MASSRFSNSAACNGCRFSTFLPLVFAILLINGCAHVQKPAPRINSEIFSASPKVSRNLSSTSLNAPVASIETFPVRSETPLHEEGMSLAAIALKLFWPLLTLSVIGGVSIGILYFEHWLIRRKLKQIEPVRLTRKLNIVRTGGIH
jgi:hypothetical protein